MKFKTLLFPLSLIVASSALAGQFVWTGSTDSSWTDVSNWDVTSVPPVSTDTSPLYGSTYASDFLNIRNNGDFMTPGAGAVYDPGVGVTTTFSGGRCFVVGVGSVGTNGFADLEVKSGTIAAPRSLNSGSEPFMANRTTSNLLITGGAVDLSGNSNNFRLIQEGQLGITSTITISSGSLTCAFLDLYFDEENDPATAFGTGIINLDGGVLEVNRFGRTRGADPGQTSFKINLNGGTLRARNNNANFLPPLADTETIIKTGGVIIDTNGFNSTIAEDLEHDAALGATLDGGIQKIGSGNLVITGTNTYTGGFTNDGTGNITPNSDAAFGTGPVVSNAGQVFATATTTFSNTLALNNTTLRIGGSGSKTITWNGPVTVTGASGISADGGTGGITLTSTLDITGATFGSFGNGNNNNIDGAISGVDGNLEVTGGTLQLSGTNTYTGTTTLSGSAILRPQPTGTISSSSDIIINGAGNFNPRNTVGWVYSGTITGDGTGSINLNNGTDAELAGNISGLSAVNANGTGTDTTISGNISGANDINVQNSGGPILRLSGDNSYTGKTTINNTGTLVLESANALPDTTAVSIASGTLNATVVGTDTTGTLGVTNTATINLATDAKLAFADSSAVDWTGGSLDITGSFISGSSLRFGTDANGLLPAQLGAITAAGFGPFSLDVSGFLTASLAGGYSVWAATNAPSGTSNDDFDGDGVTNGVEYVVGGTALTHDLGKLPTASASGGDFIFTFQRDQSATDALTQVQVGTTLAAWPAVYTVLNNAAVQEAGITVVDNPGNPGFDTVTLTIVQAPDARKFARLKVTP